MPFGFFFFFVGRTLFGGNSFLFSSWALQLFFMGIKIALYQDNMKITNEDVGELTCLLDESTLKMEAKEKELEDQKTQYAELYKESMSVVFKAMLKVREDLYR